MRTAQWIIIGIAAAAAGGAAYYFLLRKKEEEKGGAVTPRPIDSTTVDPALAISTAKALMIPVARTNGSSDNYANWATGEPNNQSEQGLAMKHEPPYHEGSWNDSNGSYPALIYLPLTDSLTLTTGEYDVADHAGIEAAAAQLQGVWWRPRSENENVAAHELMKSIGAFQIWLNPGVSGSVWSAFA